MIRIGLLAGTLAIVATSTPALAQSELAPLATKKTFTKDDVARIGNAVDDLARKYGKAEEPNLARVLAETRKLIDDSKTTPEFKATFGVEYARAFEPFFTAQSLYRAFGPVLLLEKVSSPEIRDKFIAIVTSSPQPAVRYVAVKGLLPLLASAKSPRDSETIVDVLGQQGASESDPVVLEMIYEVLQSAADRPDFPAPDQVARALSTIFDARSNALNSGTGRTVSDATGFAAAAAAYAGIKRDVRTQRRLVLSLARHLAYYGRRYAQLGPTGGGTRLKDDAKACEDALIKIVQAADVSPPSAGQRLAAKISSGAPVKEVQDALAGWIGASGKPGVLNGDPWKVPVGLAP